MCLPSSISECNVEFSAVTDCSLMTFLLKQHAHMHTSTHPPSMISEDSDFLYNLNMPFLQHTKMFGSARAYFSCVVLTGRDLTLPIKRSLKKKKKNSSSCLVEMLLQCSSLGFSKDGALRSILRYLLDVPHCYLLHNLSCWSAFRLWRGE